MKTTILSTLLVAAFVTAGWIGGCSPDLETADSPETGEVSFDLQVAFGLTLNTVNYTITGPNAFERSYTLEGNLGQHEPSTVSAIISKMLPARN